MALKLKNCVLLSKQQLRPLIEQTAIQANGELYSSPQVEAVTWETRYVSSKTKRPK